MSNSVEMLGSKLTTKASLLSLSPETRVNIHEYLLPPQAQPGEYAGLRRSCRLLCEEFDAEASSNVRGEFNTFCWKLSEKGIVVQSSFIDTFNTKTLIMKMPLYLLQRGPTVRTDLIPPTAIPFQWSWLRRVVLTFDMDRAPSEDVAEWMRLVSNVDNILCENSVREQSILKDRIAALMQLQGGLDQTDVSQLSPSTSIDDVILTLSTKRSLPTQPYANERHWLKAVRERRIVKSDWQLLCDSDSIGYDCSVRWQRATKKAPDPIVASQPSLWERLNLWAHAFINGISGMASRLWRRWRRTHLDPADWQARLV